MWHFHKNAPFARKLEHLTKKKQNLILIDNVITILLNVITFEVKCEIFIKMHHLQENWNI